jgi:hypothetical protein
MASTARRTGIPGIAIFDGETAPKGYALDARAEDFRVVVLGAGFRALEESHG